MTRDRIRGLTIGCCVCVLTGCAGALSWNPPGATAYQPSVVTPEPTPHSYVVQSGETLYSIAWRYGLDYHDIAAWNRIGSSYLIKPGQRLMLAAPAHYIAARPPAQSAVPRSAATAPGESAADYAPPFGTLRWVWPTQGAVVRLFHAGDPLSKGIDISGTQGQNVYAAAPGKVVYTGSAIIGYGKLIIIKNSEQFLSAYADNDAMLVREGAVVRAGERIATMGLNRDGHPLLHFEIRYSGKPVDPMSYLPAR